MYKNLFLTVFAFIAAALLLAHAAPASADDEKVPMDPVLHEELCRMIEKNFTGITWRGRYQMKVDGVDRNFKYVMNSIDLENFRYECEEEGMKLIIMLRPDRMIYYNEKEKQAVEFKNKRILLRVNFKMYLAAIKNNGMIIKKVKDGKVTYTVSDYDSNVKMILKFDVNTGSLESKIDVDNMSGEKNEVTYESKETGKFGEELFKIPSGVNFINGDKY